MGHTLAENCMTWSVPIYRDMANLVFFRRCNAGVEDRNWQHLRQVQWQLYHKAHMHALSGMSLYIVYFTPEDDNTLGLTVSDSLGIIGVSCRPARAVVDTDKASIHLW